MLSLQLACRFARVFRHASVVVAALVLASCVTPKPPNTAAIPLKAAQADRNCIPHAVGVQAGQAVTLPKADWQACSDYRPVSVQTPESDKFQKSPNVLFMAALSGGGKRSAAFAYGVFQELHKRAISLPDELGSPSEGMTLLKEIDVMTGVSGGSLTASYYALHHENIFLQQDCGFEKFLYEDTGAQIWGMYLLPWKWNWALDSGFGSNDLLAEHFAKRLFMKPVSEGCPVPFAENEKRPNGATYQDLYDRGAPLLLVEATDTTRGMAFPLTQDGFDLLCADISQFPVAWSVAASSAFPILLSTVNLTNNHGSECKPSNNPYVARIQARSDGCTPIEVLLDKPDVVKVDESELFRSSIVWESAVSCFLNPGDARYLHLADGGATDNYALRGLVDWLMSNEQSKSPAFWTIVHNTRRALLLIIDGQKDVDPSLSRKVDGPTLFEAADAMISNTVDNGNMTSLADTVTMLDGLGKYLALRDVVIVERMIKNCRTFKASPSTNEVIQFRKYVDLMTGIKKDDSGLVHDKTCFDFDLEFVAYTNDFKTSRMAGDSSPSAHAFDRTIHHMSFILGIADRYGRLSTLQSNPPWNHPGFGRLYAELLGRPENQPGSIEIRVSLVG